MTDALPHTPAVPDPAEEAAWQARWESEARREFYRWRHWADRPCPHCGELVGHCGGSAEREPCELIPLNVPLDEIRPNCLVVRRIWIGDAIRAACEKRGA